MCRTQGISSVLLLPGVGCNPCRRVTHVWQTKRLDRLDEILKQLVVVKKCSAEAKLQAFEHGRYLKGQRVDNKGKESSGWKIQDGLLQSLITAEEGAGTNTDIQNSQDLG